MARSLWSGSISFGLVYIPVKLFSAIRHREVHFHNVHDKDGGRIREKRVCEQDDREVSYAHVAKGYQLSKSKIVMITQAELDAADPKASRTLSIHDFVDLESIDPMYYQTTYYVEPDADARKSFALFRDAMRETGKVAIVSFVMRQNQYIAALRPLGNSILLTTMLYADEILPGGKGSAGSKPTAKEKQLAERLIKQLSGSFKPTKYKDTHRARVLALVKRKAKGERIKPVKVTRERTHVEHLLRQLEESVSAKR
ncbi:MAG: Ku protein [Candidatus Andersenbacteria bacterium]